MDTIRRRGTAAVAALALLGAVLVTGAASPAGGAAYQGNCRGADAATQALLGVLGGSLTIPVEVTGTVSDTVAPDDGSFPVDFSWALKVDGASSDFEALWDVVGANSISASVSGVKLPVLVSGNGTTATNVTGTPPDRSVTIVRGETSSITEGPFTADIPITGDAGDQIVFTVGNPELTLGLDIASLGGNTELALVCDISRKFATTTIAVEGAPTIDSVDKQVDKGGTVTVDVNELITEGDSPLIPGSLEIAEQPAEGTAALSDDGILTYDAPDADTEVSIGLKVCGEEIEVVPANPGTDEVQQLVVEEPYVANKKALRISYVVNDTETALRDQTEPGGLPVFSEPKPPLAAELQAHLETAPGVSAGDIVVTGGPDAADRLGTQTNPYAITYTGTLATTDVADLVVGEFQGWPPRAWLDAIVEFASGLGGGGEDGDGGETEGGDTGDEGGGSALDDFLADLDVNAILESITNLFPGPP
ncbi:MAG: hypothetical protein ACERLM_10235, partial [Acidimicrobiales bacterium]